MAKIKSAPTNPHHRRAKLVTLTTQGRRLYDAADALQKPWGHMLAAGIDERRLAAARRTLEELRRRLEEQSEADKDGP